MNAVRNEVNNRASYIDVGIGSERFVTVMYMIPFVLDMPDAKSLGKVITALRNCKGSQYDLDVT